MLSARLFRKILCSGTGNLPLLGGWNKGKRICLTFDDGPHPIYSRQIMDLLAQYNIKATFFVTGQNIERNPEIAKQIVQKGHVLGNHTYSHKILPTVLKDDRILEIMKCQRLIDGLQQSSVKLFRPPQGLIFPSDYIYLLRNDFRLMLWNVDSKDHLPTKINNSCLLQLPSKNNIVLFHDDSSVCVDLLKNLIPHWLRQGFQFNNL